DVDGRLRDEHHGLSLVRSGLLAGDGTGLARALGHLETWLANARGQHEERHPGREQGGSEQPRHTYPRTEQPTCPHPPVAPGWGRGAEDRGAAHAWWRDRASPSP